MKKLRPVSVRSLRVDRFLAGCIRLAGGGTLVATLGILVFLLGHVAPFLADSPQRDGLLLSTSQWVLLWGSGKVALLAVLFAAPLALAAALFATEYLPARTVQASRPFVDLMGAVPTVILGVLALLLVGPWLGAHLFPVFFYFWSGPWALVLFALLWSTLPPGWMAAVRGLPMLGIGVLLVLGHLALCLTFADPLWLRLVGVGFPGWLAGQGPGWPLWVGLLAPCLGLLASLRDPLYTRSPLVFRLALALIVSLPLGHFLSGLFDLRALLCGEWSPRNGFLAGAVLALSLLPRMLVRAEEVFSSVPRSLRAASLSCGATRWQTARRLVVPMSLPGIAGVLLSCLGLALGETMILLMVSGNAAQVDLSLFAPVRTVTSDLVLCLPETGQGGARYHELVVNATALLLLCFMVHTLAFRLHERHRRKIGGME